MNILNLTDGEHTFLTTLLTTLHLTAQDTEATYTHESLMEAIIKKLSECIEPAPSVFNSDRYTDADRTGMVDSLSAEISDSLRDYAESQLAQLGIDELDGYVINLELFEHLLQSVVDNKLALDNAWLHGRSLDFARMLELGIFVKEDSIYAKLTDHGRAVAAKYGL